MSTKHQTESKEKFIQKMNDLFKSFDTDGDGSISFEEYEKISSQLLIKDTLQKTVSKEHPISQQEFQDLSLKGYDFLYGIFKNMDINNDGTINFEEMRTVISQNQVDLDDESIQEIFKKYDTNGDGVIDFSEWVDILLYIPNFKDVNDLFSYWKQVTMRMTIEEELPIQIKKSEASSDQYKFMIAGALSGGASKTGTAPLERVKILKQVNPNFAKMTSGALLKELYKNEGIRGLFKGNGIHVLKSSPEKSINFLIYENVKYLFKNLRKGGDLSSLELLLAGSIAGGVSTAILHPMDVIKTQLTANPKTPTVASVLTNLIQEGKTNPSSSSLKRIKPFFKGLGTNLGGTIPSAGVNIMFYELIKDKIYGKHPLEQPGIVPIMGIGASSAIISAGIFYPLTLLKSKIMMKTDPSQTILTISKDVFKSYGFKGFYKGFAIATAKVVPQNSIAFAVYEASKVLLGVNK